MNVLRLLRKLIDESDIQIVERENMKQRNCKCARMNSL